MLACAGCLDGCVQCQQIGLVGNAGDGFHDLADFLGALPQLVHGGGGAVDYLLHADNLLDGAADGCAACLSLLVGFYYVVVHILGGVIEPVDGFHGMVDGDHGILHILLLLQHCPGGVGDGLGHHFRGFCCLMGAGGELLRGSCQLLSGVQHLLDEVVDGDAHGLHALLHVAEFIGAAIGADFAAGAEVTLGELVTDRHHQIQRAHDVPGDRYHSEGQHKDDEHAANSHVADGCAHVIFALQQGFLRPLLIHLLGLCQVGSQLHHQRHDVFLIVVHGGALVSPVKGVHLQELPAVGRILVESLPGLGCQGCPVRMIGIELLVLLHGLLCFLGGLLELLYAVLAAVRRHGIRLQRRLHLRPAGVVAHPADMVDAHGVVVVQGLYVLLG